MPIENEVKWVINLDCEEELNNITSQKIEIKQGYINDIRLRSNVYPNSKSETRSLYVGLDPFLPPAFKSHEKQDTKSYEFCYKHKFEDRIIEIETTISQSDFLSLWPLTTDRVYKTRYNLVCSEGDSVLIWEIDFFKQPIDYPFSNKEEPYFAMAELEMPIKQIDPAFIPRFLEDKIIFKSELRDPKFTSRALSNVEYARNLLKELCQSQ